MDEYGDLMMALMGMGGAQTACGKALREWMCFNFQPQSRFNPAAKSRIACPVCRSVCEAYVQDCEASAREALYATLAALLPQFYTDTGLCELNEWSEAKQSLAALFLGNCSNYPAAGGCTSGDVSTCAQLALAPVAVFGAHGFREYRADASFFSNEIQSLANEESEPSELRPMEGGGVRLDGHGSILIPPGSTLTLTGAAAQPQTRLGGRVNQYTTVSYARTHSCVALTHTPLDNSKHAGHGHAVHE